MSGEPFPTGVFEGPPGPPGPAGKHIAFQFLFILSAVSLLTLYKKKVDQYYSFNIFYHSQSQIYILNQTKYLLYLTRQKLFIFAYIINAIYKSDISIKNALLYYCFQARGKNRTINFLIIIYLFS